MKKFVLPLVFVVAGMSFVTYSFLDTFVIPKNTKAVSFNDDDFWGVSSSSSSRSSSSKHYDVEGQGVVRF